MSHVTFRKIKYQKGHPEKHYLTTSRDCKSCPFAKECLGRSKEKRIRITAYKEEYDRAKERAESVKGKIMKKKRQSTVEPVFGKDCATVLSIRQAGTVYLNEL